MGGSNTIEENGGNMSGGNVRRTSRIEEAEDGYGDNEEKEPGPEDEEDRDEVSAFVQAYLSQKDY